ncbi:hypothetical protein ASY01nite_23730 [Acetobacter syzygii]|nr:hypothetical protein Absy_018_003 [Acetobacter syzygii]GEL57307.1 hypothetical protein ASY01nite_23730 [Acetobacter syzygii]
MGAQKASIILQKTGGVVFVEPARAGWPSVNGVTLCLSVVSVAGRKQVVSLSS